MNIRELSRRTGVSLSTLKTLDKLKVLKLSADPEGDKIEAIKFSLTKNPALTVMQILDLTAQPDLISELGNFEHRARVHLETMGDIKAQAAPTSVTAFLVEAYCRDPIALEVLADWARSILPPKAVGYHWLASRLLFNAPEVSRQKDAKRIPLTFVNLRKVESFAGFWQMNIKREFEYFQKVSLDL